MKKIDKQSKPSGGLVRVKGGFKVSWLKLSEGSSITISLKYIYS